MATTAAGQFNLANDLTVFARARADQLRESIYDLTQSKGCPYDYYGKQFEASKTICRKLAVDPFKVSFQAIDKIITLPNLKELTDAAFRLGKNKPDLKALFTDLVKLFPLIVKTFVPVIEDCVSLGSTIEDKEARREFVQDLLTNGIELNPDTKLFISTILDLGDDHITFAIQQGGYRLEFCEGDNPGKFNMDLYDKDSNRYRSYAVIS